MGSRPFSTIDLNYICCALRMWTYPFIHQKNSCEGKKPYETKKGNITKSAWHLQLKLQIFLIRPLTHTEFVSRSSGVTFDLHCMSLSKLYHIHMWYVV